MPFHAIQGQFFCVNYSPDGDTVRFKPDDLDDLDLLDGVPAAVNGRGHVSIRFEGIDALETHFERRHQPLALANAARNAVLAKLGIKNVVWDENAGNVVSAQDGTRGHIITRATDKFGLMMMDARQFVEELTDERGDIGCKPATARILGAAPSARDVKGDAEIKRRRAGREKTFDDELALDGLQRPPRLAFKTGKDVAAVAHTKRLDFQERLCRQTLSKR